MVIRCPKYIVSIDISIWTFGLTVNDLDKSDDMVTALVVILS